MRFITDASLRGNLSWEYLSGLNVRYIGSPMAGDNRVTNIIAKVWVDNLLVLARLSLATQMIERIQKITKIIATIWIHRETPCHCKNPKNGEELLITTQFVSGITLRK